MSLSADSLLDRLQLKNQISRWRILAVVAIVIAFLAFFERGSVHSPIESDYIARVTIEGIITDDIKREELFDDIAENSKARALIVRLNTPGGSAVAGQELYESLYEISKKKPVIAVMRDLSASAGYLAALGADRIYASPGTLTGSIGVIIQTMEMTELANKLGIKPVTIKTGALKDALSPTTKMSPEAQRVMQGVVDDFYDVFVDTIVERRKLPRDQVLRMADGRVFTGRQAVERKLVDALGSEDDARQWLIKNKKIQKGIDIKDLKVKRDDLPFFEHITNTVMKKVVPGSTGTLDGLVAIWHPNLQLQ